MTEAKPAKQLPRTLGQRLDELWRIFNEKCAAIARAYPKQRLAAKE